MSRMSSGIEPLAGFFELWLRDEAAALMGKGAEDSWRDHVEHRSAGVPARFTLDGAVCDARQISPEKIFRLGKAPDAYPVAAAWHSFVWLATCREVGARFPEDHCVHLVSTQEPVLEKAYSMLELHIHLFLGLEDHQDHQDQWRHFANALHKASHEKLCTGSRQRQCSVSGEAFKKRQAHEKLPESGQCSVCTGSRLWQDSRWRNADWDFKTICLLWDAVVATVHQYGIAWSVWRPARPTAAVSAVPSLPPKLTMEDIPLDQVHELPGGVFKWGRYQTAPGTQSREEGWTLLNARWQEDRKVRINILREVDEHRSQMLQNQPGDKLTLRQGEQTKCYTGRVWRSSESWLFQEDGTGISVSAKLNPDVSVRQSYPQCEAKLYRAMRAEHVKQKRAIAKAAKNNAARADVPKTTSDMMVKGKSPEGKLVYAWGDLDRGRVEVEVTPRADRAPVQEQDSEFKRAAARESTPERALRKMIAKVRTLHTKAARGEQARIVAKAVGGSGTSKPQAGHMPEAAHSPALRTLNDPQALQHVIAAYEFLSSLRLHYCCNCDEHWAVFDAEWPQTGVSWVGAKAGRCETIQRAGFLASQKDASRCSRCDGPTAYSKMYCEENLQHLGPRHPALSALTWYESLLIARVHPVMSVITLTATGLLCYAGHVCNYYVKVMEWVRDLPAVLRDKKWFLIKRRRSIRATATDARQKKPTTANRYRLEAAIQEALLYLPRVYEGSAVVPDELKRFPYDTEQEMFEQEEAMDLNGEVHLSQEVFAAWFDSGAASAAKRPCAAVIHRYALDQQGVDFRGSVSAGTAWELCCRLLSAHVEQHKLGTRDIAQLLVYWLEECQVPSQMGDAVYEGMLAELKSRAKRVETAEDEQLMKCRWVRQAIHAELDALREECAAIGDGLPVDFEVEGVHVAGFSPRDCPTGSMSKHRVSRSRTRTQCLHMDIFLNI